MFSSDIAPGYSKDYDSGAKDVCEKVWIILKEVNGYVGGRTPFDGEAALRMLTERLEEDLYWGPGDFGVDLVL